MKFRMVKINDQEALAHIARCEVYQAISDYEIWKRLTFKDPTDAEAAMMAEDCKEFLYSDPRVSRCIKEPEKLIWHIDRKVMRDLKNQKGRCLKYAQTVML